MGSIIEINDTLQITAEQGFPSELNVDQHKIKTFVAEDFAGRIFEFKAKPKIRNYQIPPIRNFLVENKDGKWIYWGLIHIIEVNHDYEKQATSGKFKILYIYSSGEMKQVHSLIDRNDKTNFFL